MSKKSIIIIFISCSIFFISKNSFADDIEDLYSSQRNYFITNKFQRNVPKIGVCFSGGGCRAMLASLGFLSGAQKIGLLDATSYISALSGSTWLMSSLFAREIIPNDEGLDFLKNVLIDNFKEPLFKKGLLGSLLSRHDHFVQVWGDLVANHIFKDDISLSYKSFSSLSPNPEYYPFTIFQAALNYEKGFCLCCKKTEKRVIEFNPATYSFAGGQFLTRDLECRCQDIYDQIPSMSFFLGVFGSAYAGSLFDMIDYVREEISSRALNKKFIIKELWNSIQRGRLMPAVIPLEGKKVTVIDGGYISNLPLLPLLKRNLDIIFIVDASDIAPNGKMSELKKLALYVQKFEENYNLPDIFELKPEEFIRNGFSLKVFKQEGKTTLVYFTLPKELNYNTTKFQFSSAESSSIISYMEQSVLNLVKEIDKLIFS